jgi:Trk K+ transport system NAD-binding subunit
LFILKFRRKSHAVICGLGYVGPVIALYLLKKGIPVVIIENDKDNKALEVCSKQGALTIVGDASIEYYLKKANIQKAQCLFTVSGDDETNTRIALWHNRFSNRYRGEPNKKH